MPHGKEINHTEGIDHGICLFFDYCVGASLVGARLTDGGQPRGIAPTLF